MRLGQRGESILPAERRQRFELADRGRQRDEARALRSSRARQRRRARRSRPAAAVSSTRPSRGLKTADGRDFGSAEKTALVRASSPSSSARSFVSLVIVQYGIVSCNGCRSFARRRQCVFFFARRRRAARLDAVFVSRRPAIAAGGYVRLERRQRVSPSVAATRAFVSPCGRAFEARATAQVERRPAEFADRVR